jgi:elongation factor Ts
LDLGWAKANKLEGRNTVQGLIGVLVKGNCASMVELNCETDFVARNAQFHELLNEVAAAAHNVGVNKEVERGALARQGQFLYTSVSFFFLPPGSLSIQHSDRESLSSIITGNGQTLGDLVALNIGMIGENIVLGRAITMTSDGGNFRLSGLTHPSSAKVYKSDKVQYGRFGALMAFAEVDGGSAMPLAQGETADSVARQVCQHIIGMNPQRVGDLSKVTLRTEEEIEVEAVALLERKQELLREAMAKAEAEGVAAELPTTEENESDALVGQSFLLDQDKTVGEVLIQTGIEVKDFVRFEIGKAAGREE